ARGVLLHHGGEHVARGPLGAERERPPRAAHATSGRVASLDDVEAEPPAERAVEGREQVRLAQRGLLGLARRRVEATVARPRLRARELGARALEAREVVVAAHGLLAPLAEARGVARARAR